MKKAIIILSVLLLIAVYFIGKQNGSSITQKTVINNVALVQEIAELSSLSVTGSTTVKLSNLNNQNNWLSNVKNFFVENTLQVTIPYAAKYGIDIANKKIDVNDAGDKIKIILPKCKLLSLQLLLDKIETMNQTGLFTHTTINQLANAQKQLYNEALTSLSSNNEYITKAENQIKSILTKYYAPLNVTVECSFEK